MRRYLNLSSEGSGSPRYTSLSVTTRPLSSLVLLSVISYLEGERREREGGGEGGEEGREGEKGRGEREGGGGGGEGGEGEGGEKRELKQKDRINCVTTYIMIHLHCYVYRYILILFVTATCETTCLCKLQTKVTNLDKVVIALPTCTHFSSNHPNKSLFIHTLPISWNNYSVIYVL